MSRYNMTARDAYKFAKNRRPEVSPNSSFMRILEEYEQELKRAKNLRPVSNNNNNLVTNNKQQHYASNNDLFHSQEQANFNLPNNSLKYNKNLESFFYDNSRQNSQPQIQSSPRQQQQPSTYGFRNANNKSPTNLSLFGFPNNENYNNTYNNLNYNNNNKTSMTNNLNYGAYNLNRNNLNRYMSNPSLNMTGAVGGGGGGGDYDNNFQYF